MDPHTLELLGYDKVRELLAGYAASSLGRELARRLEPSRDGAFVRAELKLTAEMVAALDDGPPRLSPACTTFVWSSVGPPSAPCSRPRNCSTSPKR